MLAHLEGCQQREGSPANLECGAAYRLFLIGHEQAALAYARPLLKFLKEKPGYGLVLPVKSQKDPQEVGV